MSKKISAKELKEFKAYVWSFYGPKGHYGEFFDYKLTKKEIDSALVLMLSHPKFNFEGDSFDREILRDILLYARGIETEYDVKKFFKKARK